ncbi:MAG TPA: hypothetical protein VFA11_16120 [Acidimicrobiales bacterium]|nr:hypothetical protein [Acidimicrobiales bacterium]
MAVGTLEAERRGTRPANLRVDWWWLQPAITFVVLLGFVVYSTWTVFTPHDFYAGPSVGRHYLSPYYSPCITNRCKGGTTWNLVSWWPFSAGILMMPFPILFRATCYYYRKAYYRSFWLSPPACAVPDAHGSYTGESRFPLILQNLHRFAFYLIIPFPIILLWEAIKGLEFGSGHWGLGLGSIILFVNAFLLGFYTLGCHAGRHICGGHLNAFSKGPVRYWVWKQMTRFNLHHMGWAWTSLVFVAWTDIYIRLVASGVIHDPRLF